MPRVAPALQPPPYPPKAALPSPPVTGARAASGLPFAGVNSSIIKFLVTKHRSSGTLWQQSAVCTQEHMVPVCVGGDGGGPGGPGDPLLPADPQGTAGGLQSGRARARRAL